MIGPTPLAVHVVLSRQAATSAMAWPSRRHIGDRVGVGIDAVAAALKMLTGQDGRLAACGLSPLIWKEHPMSEKGDATSNLYHALTEISTVRPEGVDIRRRKVRSDYGTMRPGKADVEATA